MTDPVTLSLRQESSERWLHRLAVSAAAVALLLTIPWGGLVTSLKAGMAVPDYPNTYGRALFAYPLSEMKGGVAVEHTHRLLASMLGLLTLLLTVALMVLDRRPAVRRLAGVALAAVLAQGLLGGFRVLMNERFLAIVHAVVAQAFFGLLVAVAAVISPAWAKAGAPTREEGAQLRGLAVATVVVVSLQIVLGVLLRHLGWGLPYHLTVAALAAFAVWTLTGEILRSHRDRRVLARLARAQRGVLAAQLALGLASWAVTTSRGGAVDPLLRAATTAGHVALGAALLGTSVVLAAWIHRTFAPRILSGAGGIAPVSEGLR